MKITRKASAAWTGDTKTGKGEISTGSGALQAYPYGFASRFEGVAGSNPEELLGAAHAACFTMALTLVLGRAGFSADRLETSAEVTLEQIEGGFVITKSALTLTGIVPGASVDQFLAMASEAKQTCPLSKVINAEITLDATLTA